MAAIPVLAPPIEGQRISIHLDYAKRQTSLGQAADWNSIFANDPDKRTGS